MTILIRLDISKEDYEEGLRMMGQAAQIAWSHGLWDVKKAGKVFTENGWLPPFEEAENDFAPSCYESYDCGNEPPIPSDLWWKPCCEKCPYKKQ
jgi:hypothetical protein